MDEWIKTEDGPSFRMARRLIRREGLLVGGSSGSAAWATLQYAKNMKPGQRVLTILPDGVRNYHDQVPGRQVDGREPLRQGALGRGRGRRPAGGLPERELFTITDADRVGNAVNAMKSHGISQLPVLDEQACWRAS